MIDRVRDSNEPITEIKEQIANDEGLIVLQISN